MRMLLSTVLFAVLVSAAIPVQAAQKIATKDDDEKIVALNVGDKLLVRLPGNYTTGYQWVVKQGYDKDVIEQAGDGKYKPDATDRVGAPGIAEFTFKAIGTGRTELELVYIRTWEKDVKPETDFEITVIVSKPKGKAKKAQSAEDVE